MPITQEQLENWFTHHPPETQDQIDTYQAIREAGKAFAEVIVQQTPASADQTAAIRKIREAVFTGQRGDCLRGQVEMPRSESHMWWRIPTPSQEASMSEKEPEPQPQPDDEKPAPAPEPEPAGAERP